MLVEGHERCQSCWFYKSVCICNKVRDMSKNTDSIQTEINIFMHFKEWGKTTNTGKLIKLIAPQKSSIHIYGTPQAQDYLNHLTSQDDKQLVILYPSENSVPISNYKYPSHNKTATSSSSSPFSATEYHSNSSKHLTASYSLLPNFQELSVANNLNKKLILCVIDSTWSQVKKK